MKDISGAILVPTHRTSPEALANLAYLAACSRADLSVYIGDNSTSAEKHHYLQSLANLYPKVHLLLYPENLGAMQNFLNLIEISKQHQLLIFATDDDHVSLNYIDRGFEDLRENPSLSRSAGLMLCQLSRGDISVDGKASMAMSPSARFNEYFDPNSFNQIFYSVFRRKDIYHWLEFRASHPLPGVFFDFLLTLSTLSAGRFFRHSCGHHIYRSENWDQPDKNELSRSRSYTFLGMPGNFASFHDFHFGVECLNFLLGRFSPISDRNEAVKCADIVWSRCIGRFSLAYRNNQDAYLSLLGGNEILAKRIFSLISQPTISVQEVLEIFSTLLRLYSLEIGAKYDKFLAYNYA